MPRVLLTRNSRCQYRRPSCKGSRCTRCETCSYFPGAPSFYSSCMGHHSCVTELTNPIEMHRTATRRREAGLSGTMGREFTEGANLGRRTDGASAAVHGDAWTRAGRTVGRASRSGVSYFIRDRADARGRSRLWSDGRRRFKAHGTMSLTSLPPTFPSGSCWHARAPIWRATLEGRRGSDFRHTRSLLW